MVPAICLPIAKPGTEEAAEGMEREEGQANCCCPEETNQGRTEERVDRKGDSQGKWK